MHGIITAVSRQAVIKRINRALAKEDEALRTTRGDRWRIDLGDHYLLNLRTNAIAATHVDPEELGRELGVLKRWEHLAE